MDMNMMAIYLYKCRWT